MSVDWGGFQAISDGLSTLKDALSAPTIGVLWTAATGTFDPWSKQQEIQKEADALVRAGMSLSAAQAQAEADWTNQLQAAGRDPSQIPDEYRQLGEVLTWALLALAIYLAVQIAFLGKQWKEVLSP